MTHRYRLALVLLVTVIIVVGMLVCRWWPSHGPLARAAPASPAVRWTAQGALSRCRSQAGCWLLYSGAGAQYLDEGAVSGDQYSLGRFVQGDGALTIVGWSKATLTGGRVWLPVGGR